MLIPPLHRTDVLKSMSPISSKKFSSEINESDEFESSVIATRPILHIYFFKKKV